MERVFLITQDKQNYLKVVGFRCSVYQRFGGIRTAKENFVLYSLFEFFKSPACCKGDIWSLNLWRRMTERNILRLKSAMSAAKSMSPLRNKKESSGMEVATENVKESCGMKPSFSRNPPHSKWINHNKPLRAQKSSHRYLSFVTWWEQCESHLYASQQTC